MMERAKFFRFILQGDGLDLDKIEKSVTLQGVSYRKGETIVKELFGEEHYIFQKTNRWVYKDNKDDNSSLSAFLTKNLKIIYRHLRQLKGFILNDRAFMELVVYAGDKTDIRLSKQQIKLLNDIGVKFLISFC